MQPSKTAPPPDGGNQRSSEAHATLFDPVRSAPIPAETMAEGKNTASSNTGQNTPYGAPARTLLATVFLIGTLLTLLGSVLPVWGYHRLDEFIAAGNHFLLLALGNAIANVIASRGAQRLPQWVFSPLPGSAIAFLAIILFALLPPPFPTELQLAGAFCAGLAVGALNATLFQQLGALGMLRSSAAFHLASVFFLVGCIVTPLAVAAAVTPNNSLSLLVLLPAPLLVGFSLRSQRVSATAPGTTQRQFREAVGDFRNPPAVLLALLLLFQLGNEMAIVGWLPVFLIQRLGVSPATGLYSLAAFSFALLLGRIGVQALARHSWRNRLSLLGIGVALLGCLMLAFTNNLFGAMFGIALTGLGFAPIFPAALELVGNRFPYFHPAIFNSIFSIGLVGGMLAPWSLGLLTHAYGIQFVMVLPILGLLMVALILGLVWVEAKLTGAMH